MFVNAQSTTCVYVCARRVCVVCVTVCVLIVVVVVLVVVDRSTAVLHYLHSPGSVERGRHRYWTIRRDPEQGEVQV